MSKNIIITRQSPNWLEFDLEETRAFCRNVNLPEDTVISFANNWDAVMRVPFINFRDELKSISLASIRDVKFAEVCEILNINNIKIRDDDLIYFTDDDDWVCPDIFVQLKKYALNSDGFIWNSVYVGKMFYDTPGAKMETPIVSVRDLDNTVYTNNYAISGRTFAKWGRDAVLEHYSIQPYVNKGDIYLSPISLPLTAANKHLCCTVCIFYNCKDARFNNMIEQAVRSIILELESVNLNDNHQWMNPYLLKLKELYMKALG